MRDHLLHSALAAIGLILLTDIARAAPYPAGSERGGTAALKVWQRSAAEQPVVQQVKRLSKWRAARLASQRGFKFFYPGYWPRSLPRPSISAYEGSAHRNVEAYRTAITVSAEKKLPYKDVKGVSPSIIANRSRKFITIILDRPERIPEHLKLDFRRNPRESPQRYPRPPGSEGYTLPITIRGMSGMILRERPAINLAWTSGGTYILIISINVREDQVLKIARSLRAVEVTNELPRTRPPERSRRHAVQHD